MPTANPEYPEHIKLHAVQDKSQAVHDFLEWLYETHGIELAQMHKHGPQCQGWNPKENRYDPGSGDRCALREGDYYGCGTTLKKLLAEFFEIDLDKLEAEKAKLLEEQRKLNARNR